MQFSIMSKDDNGTRKFYWSQCSFYTALSRLIYEYEKAGASIVDIEVYSDCECLHTERDRTDAKHN